MGCRELKDRMLFGSTLVIALVDKTRLAGHGGHMSGQKAASLGMSVRMMLAPAYTGVLASCPAILKPLSDLVCCCSAYLACLVHKAMQAMMCHPPKHWQHVERSLCHRRALHCCVWL